MPKDILDIAIRIILIASCSLFAVILLLSLLSASCPRKSFMEEALDELILDGTIKVHEDGTLYLPHGTTDVNVTAVPQNDLDNSAITAVQEENASHSNYE